MTKEETAGLIDRNAGARLRAVRADRGISQSALGDAIGVTFQQIQKYEKGTNRISISRLVIICQALNCHPMDIIGEGVDAPTSAAPLVDLAAENAKLRRAVQAVRKIVGGYAERMGIDDIDDVSAPAGPPGITHAPQTH